ncbi:copper resistance protein CopD [Lysobacter pythonis]|uniref:Copper resistance protein CopD n=1 Tax=Solilutibacter pythonis TaxID=2483112 RepID=A0A3M2HVK1_9GAMM|nr:CopD family protein [Lysobacter pythonis]RMH93771.1 copper resistance protein CopD [Lysobacter pythonis]
MYGFLLLLHVLGASVWVGGHLVLALGVLPGALRERDVAGLLAFESRYEKVGMPALAVQVVTGLWLAWRFLPEPMQWFDASTPIARLILAKLILLGLTVVIALHARLRVIPVLDGRRLPAMAGHVVAVTILSVLFVVVGLSARAGWLA